MRFASRLPLVLLAALAAARAYMSYMSLTDIGPSIAEYSSSAYSRWLGRSSFPFTGTLWA